MYNYILRMLDGSHGPQENFSWSNKMVSFNFIYGKLKSLVCNFIMVTILIKEIYLGGDVTTKSSKIDPQQTVMSNE